MVYGSDSLLKLLTDGWSGEWWNANPVDVIREAQRTGGAPNVSDAFTINGQPGDLFKCSNKGMYLMMISITTCSHARSGA